MSDLLQVSDLEKAKMHDTFHSEVITGKAEGLAGGADIDFATNAVTGQVQKTLPKIINDLDWSPVGLFAGGVTFTKITDFAIDNDGTQWIYIGTYPFTATAGTIPSEPTYQAVHVKSASAISNANGGSAQDFIDSFALKIFQSPTNGGLTEIQTRTGNANEVYEVRKVSDDSLATIYSDAAGTSEIVQNGTDNKSGGDGVVEFYIADGEYYVEVGGARVLFTNSKHQKFKVNDVSSLLDISKNIRDGVEVETAAFFSGVSTGGNEYEWSTATPKSLHNGISIIDPEKTLELGPAGDFGSYFTASGSGSGCFVSKTPNFKLHATHAGACPKIDSTSAIINYCLFMTKHQLACDFTGHTFVYSSTIDLTSLTNRNAIFKGDCEDLNNVGRFNLIYTGAGEAIKVKSCRLEYFGLSGFGNSVYSVGNLLVRAGTTGVSVDGNLTHVESTITGFDTLYYFKGGYYSKVRGGKLSKCNNVILYRSDDGIFGPYNAYFDAQVSEFQYGITAKNGVGPLELKGSWEKWTGCVLNLAPESQIEVLLDIYTENYPTLAVANGINTFNGNLNFIAPTFAKLGKSSIKGSLVAFINGLTETLVEGSNCNVDLNTLVRVSSSGGDLPPYLYDIGLSNSFNVRGAYKFFTIDFTGVEVVSPSMGAGNVAGSYSDISGMVRGFKAELTFRSLENGWGNVAGRDTIVATTKDGWVTVSGYIDASSATSSKFFTPFTRLKTSGEFRAVCISNSATDDYTAAIRVNKDGFYITNSSGLIPVGVINFYITYPL